MKTFFNPHNNILDKDNRRIEITPKSKLTEVAWKLLRILNLSMAYKTHGNFLSFC